MKENLESVCEEAQEKHRYNYLALLEQELFTLLNKEGVWAEDISVNDKTPNTFEIFVDVDGDWKHDHLRTNYLVHLWCDQKNFEVISENEDADESDDDSYHAIHTYIVKE